MSKKTSRQRMIQTGALKGIEWMTQHERHSALYWLPITQRRAYDARVERGKKEEAA